MFHIGGYQRHKPTPHVCKSIPYVSEVHTLGLQLKHPETFGVEKFDFLFRCLIPHVPVLIRKVLICRPK